MKKGFTLLELLIVIIIIGVLAVVALTQYRNLSERARSSEAKTTIGGIRTAEKIYMEDTSTFATTALTQLGAYITPPPEGACLTTNWFVYALGNTCPAGGAAPCFSVVATRCTAGGKAPNIAAGGVYSVTLREDAAGVQERTTTMAGSPTW